MIVGVIRWRRKEKKMKTESRNTIIAFVTVLVLNCIAQTFMPEGKSIIAISSIIVMMGAKKLIQTIGDLRAEKIFRRIGIAFVIYQVIIGSAPLMLLVGGAYFFYKFYKRKKAEKETSETEKKVN